MKFLVIMFCFSLTNVLLIFPVQPVTRDQFDDALRHLKDEDFLIVTGRTVRIIT